MCLEYISLLKIERDKNTSLLDFIAYKRFSDKKEPNTLWVKRRILLMPKLFLIKFKASMCFLTWHTI